VPKTPKPESVLDYRPISVTPLLSRLAEKLVVSRWLIPAIPTHLIADQFAFRTTGSTTCALAYLMHHVTAMLERCLYVRCLMVDFSKAFDRVNHAILLAKLDKLDLPPQAINWIISYLTARTQTLKWDKYLSDYVEINRSIIQGSGIGPTLYIVMESDLNTLSAMNLFVKYADDTNLLVPADSDTDIADEFENLKRWSLANDMDINFAKTKEIVFRRPNPRSIVQPVPLAQVEQVRCAKLLGIFLNQTIQFDEHINNVLKICSQRIYLLKLLRDQGMPQVHLNTVFRAIVIAKIIYAISVWHGFLSSALVGKINGFLKRSYKYGFCDQLLHVNDLAENADLSLFTKMLKDNHCLHVLLPPIKTATQHLRPKGHGYELPRCGYGVHKRSFLPRCLFKYL
jgi:hypothetical protein